MLRIAQLSDTHLDGSADRTRRTRRAIDWLERLSTPVDLVVVTGDITDHGTPAEYAVARTALATRLPLVALPGNHDRRGPFRVGLLDQPDLSPGAGDSDADPDAHPDASEIDQVRDLGGLTVVCLDSTVPGSVAGALSTPTLGVLERALLTRAGRPALIALHHPPVAFGLGPMDAIGLADASDLEAVVVRHPDVVGIICGHVHTAATGTFAGLPVWAAPAIGFGAHLPGEPESGPDPATSPALSLHVIDGRRLTTQLKVV